MNDSEKAELIKGVDGFEYSIDHPRFAAHQLLEKYFESLPVDKCSWLRKADDTEAGRVILGSKPEVQAQVVIAAFERRQLQQLNSEYHHAFNASLHNLLEALLRRKLPFQGGDVYFLVCKAEKYWWSFNGYVVKIAERFGKENGFDDELREGLLQLQKQIAGYKSTDNQRLAGRIDGMLSVESRGAFEPDEAWANAANETLQNLPPKEAAMWSSLIAHCKGATAAKPSNKWLQEAQRLTDAIGFEIFSTRLQSWLKEFAAHHEAVNETNLDALKGLVWCASLRHEVSMLRAIASVVPACVKNVEHHRQYTYNGQTHQTTDRTVRAPRLANACLWVLSQSDDVEAVAQLARLRLKVRHKGILNAIEKSLADTAKRLDVAPEELEELATPDFGLQNGQLQRRWNDIHLAIDFAGGKAVWNWTDASGKPLKAPPAKWKIEYSNELKELKNTVSEIEKTFVVVKERLDLMLRLERSWTYEAWRERYFDHALLGEVSRRVIWQWRQNGETTIGIWHDDGFVDANGDKVSQPEDGAQMQLWHPIHATTEEVAAWRRWLETSRTRQPFKQAHREIYILTDAERTTRTYSNRFAAHIIRQHQFNSLCAARGWKNKLRLMVDDTYPPATKLLPQYNLRAEFWIEGIGDNYGADTNDAGTYLRLATDQVRFYRLDAAENRAQAGDGNYGTRAWGAPLAEPLSLQEIPPLVFSEVMRDVDLFVGVASVGNDPTWNDGGPQGRHIDYWRDYAFGDLSQTAHTRRDVLSRLLPRLKIADKCELLDKFLQVRGDLRTYKIHLGSGNILMAPNDQYLCIVPARGTSPDNKVFLPFEGDHTLAIILSKAFLLADDTKISDPTITLQLKR